MPKPDGSIARCPPNNIRWGDNLLKNVPLENVNECLAIAHIGDDEISITHKPSGTALCFLKVGQESLARKLALRFWAKLPEKSKLIWMTANPSKICRDASPRWLVGWLRQSAKEGKYKNLPKLQDRM